MELEQKIQILKDLIQIKTINENEKEVALYLRDVLSAYGIESNLIDYNKNRSNLVLDIFGKKEGNNKTLAYSGHFDVVDIGDQSDWSFPPFAGEISDDGYMYGRGTADMKAGVAAMIIAIIELHEEGLPFSGTLRFLGSIGEEMGMLGSQQLTEENYTKDIDALVIAEPTNNEIIYAHKGSLQYEIISTGRSAHSSMPERGINALTQLTEFIQTAEKRFKQKLEEFTNDKLGSITNSFTVIHGGEQINSIPSKVSVLANTRTIPEFDNSDVINLLNKLVKNHNNNNDGEIKLKILQDVYPVQSSTNSNIIQSILKANKQDMKLATLAGATDASNYLQVDNDIELAVYSNFDYSQAHTVDEKIKINDYLNIIDIYKEIALDYLN